MRKIIQDFDGARQHGNVQEILPATSWNGHRCTDESELIFTPPGLRFRRRPCVTLSKFKRGGGDVCINFQLYTLHSPGIIAPTRFGISLSLAEFDIVVSKITRALRAVGAP